MSLDRVKQRKVCICKKGVAWFRASEKIEVDEEVATSTWVTTTMYIAAIT